MDERRMTTGEVVESVTREYARLMAAVRALGPEASTRAVTPEGWTAKDVVAHCIHWVTQVAFGLGVPAEYPAYMAEERRRREQAGMSDPPMPTGDESNALVVAHYRDAGIEQVTAELDALLDAILARARELTDEQMNATDAVAWAPDRPLWYVIANETFAHWPQHTADIERAAAGR